MFPFTDRLEAKEKSSWYVLMHLCGYVSANRRTIWHQNKRIEPLWGGVQSGERVTKRRTCGILYFTRQSEGDYTSSTPAKILVVQNDRLLLSRRSFCVLYCYKLWCNDENNIIPSLTVENKKSATILEKYVASSFFLYIFPFRFLPALLPILWHDNIPVGAKPFW